MHRPSTMLTPAHVLGEAVAELVHCLGLRDFGRKLPATMLARLLALAAAAGTSISDAVARCRRAPSDETARKGLLAHLPPDTAELRDRLAAGLHARLPAALRRRPQPLAADITLRPFYGDRDTPGTWRGRSKAGTGRFWAYATVVALARGRRWTVALTPVANAEPPDRVLARLLDQVAAAGVTARYLVLDRGFYAAKVVALLQGRGIGFVVPVVRRGRKPDDRRGPSGTQPFFARDARGVTDYTWKGRRRTDPTVRVRVGIVPRRGRGPLVYAFDGVSFGSLTGLVRAYRRRFGIEASYRQMGQGLARTTSVDARVRLLLTGVALLVRNLWVWLHWAVVSAPRRGGRAVRLPRLRLGVMLEWLAWAVGEALEVRREAPNERGSPVGVGA